MVVLGQGKNKEEGDSKRIRKGCKKERKGRKKGQVKGV